MGAQGRGEVTTTRQVGGRSVKFLIRESRSLESTTDTDCILLCFSLASPPSLPSLPQEQGGGGDCSARVCLQEHGDCTGGEQASGHQGRGGRWRAASGSSIENLAYQGLKEE